MWPRDHYRQPHEEGCPSSAEVEEEEHDLERTKGVAVGR